MKPRPPALTSIPSLLSVFQNEWDALALETFTLKQHLAQLRQELSTALYNNDAAVRVIARLTKERDEARDALGRVSMQDRRAAGSANGTNGEAMQVDAPAMSGVVAEKITATQERYGSPLRYFSYASIVGLPRSIHLPCYVVGEAIAMRSSRSHFLW